MNLLMVCLGNICRSPLAEGLMRRELDRAGLTDFGVDSCGTGDWHIGDLADPRSRRVARAHGLELTHRARQLKTEDFRRFDLILAMDASNLNDLRALAPDAAARAKVRLIREWDPQGEGPVPDPYYGTEADFEGVYQMLERSCRALAESLK